MGGALARPGRAMIDEMTSAVARAAGVSPEQAALAVAGMLRFMAARLPSPLFGELQSRLQAVGAPGPTGQTGPTVPAGPADAAGSAKQP
jgi:hypothetical protein